MAVESLSALYEVKSGEDILTLYDELFYEILCAMHQNVERKTDTLMYFYEGYD